MSLSHWNQSHIRYCYQGDQLEEFDEFEFEDDYGVDHEASDDGDDYGDEGEAIF
jgi:hypothetical protein